MTDFDEICEEAIGGARLLGAAADFIEACRVYLARHNFPEDEYSHVLGSVWPRRIRRTLTLGGTLFPVAAGVSLILNWPPGLHFLMPAQICCLYLSIGNAWVFAVEIPRRKEVAGKSEV